MALTRDEIVTQNMLRYFLQKDGPLPVNPVAYAGVDADYMFVDGASIPHGEETAINVQNVSKFKAFQRASSEVSPPDDPSATLHISRGKGHTGSHLYDLANCYHNLYEVCGVCRAPDDFDENSSIMIYSQGSPNNTDLGGGAFDADGRVEDTIPSKYRAIYPTGLLSFEEVDNDFVVYAVVYGSRVNCGICGTSDNGTKLIYAAVSDGVAAPKIRFSNDGGDTFSDVAITGVGLTATILDMDVVGQRLVVYMKDGGNPNYAVANLNRITGTPESWVIVTAGFPAMTSIDAAMYALSPREVFFTVDDAVYKSTSLLQGVALEFNSGTGDEFHAIDGCGDTIVAAADSGGVFYSQDRGGSWVPASNILAGAVASVEVISDWVWWFGLSAGQVWYTTTRAETPLTQLVLPAIASGITSISKIMFATPEVGYIVYAVGGSGGLLATRNGGVTWTGGDGRLGTIPDFIVGQDMAVPTTGNDAVDGNNVVIGGVDLGGANGTVIVGKALVK